MIDEKHVDWDGLVYYDSKIKQYINDKLGDCIKVGGNVTFNELQSVEHSPSYNNLNFLYRVTTPFIADEWFEETARGKAYPSGTFVQVMDFGGVYLYAIFGGGAAGGTSVEVDLSEIYDRLQALERSVDDLIEAVEGIEIPSLDGYATKDFVTQKISEASLGGGADLSNYYTKSEVENLIESHTTEYVTVEELSETVETELQTKIDSGDISVGKISYGTF